MTAVPSTHWVWDPRFDDRQRQREGKKFGVWQRRRRRDIGIPAFYSLHLFSVYRQPYFPDSVNNFLLQKRGWETRLGPDCCFVSNSCCQDSDFSVFVNSTFLILLHTVFLLFCKKVFLTREELGVVLVSICGTQLWQACATRRYIKLPPATRCYLVRKDGGRDLLGVTMLHLSPGERTGGDFSGN